jgi:elongator complex protein 4
MARFCHDFDLAKPLDTHDIQGTLSFHPSSPVSASTGAASTQQRRTQPLVDCISAIESSLQASSSSGSVHRVIVPCLLNPTLYGSSCSHPIKLLPLIMGLRGLLRRFSHRLSVMLTLPLALHGRSSGLVRWIEHGCDGVLELCPVSETTRARSTTGKQVQGHVSQHCLPIHHERGGGWEGGNWRGNLSFKLSRSDGLVMEPFSLPPVDQEDSDRPGSRQARDKNDMLDF